MTITASALPPRRISSRLLGWTGALLSLGVALTAMRYLAGVGPVPEVVAGNRHINPALVIHVAGAATALLLAPLQFVPRLRARLPRLHRWTGRIYVAGCLLGGMSGFVLALGVSTGPVSMAGFGLLALLWIAVTAQAWRKAMQRDFAAHRRWMIRSFALTFAAVTLRLYLPLGFLLPVSFDDAYRVISFLCWVPNLLAAEWLLRRRPI
jgi:uncharacterized membrane protein